MQKLIDKKWWLAAGTRAIKTFFQTFVGTIGATALIQDVNWTLVLSASGMAAIVSLATSLGGLPEYEEDKVEVKEEVKEVEGK